MSDKGGKSPHTHDVSATSGAPLVGNGKLAIVLHFPNSVWLVDDLPSNRKNFTSNHKGYYKVRTFEHPNEVMKQINKENYPDALLCDVFFYDQVKEAERVEKEVKKLSEELKRKAKKLNANDHSRTLGISLMEQIYEHFKHQRPEFPMYAYTSKGPFLLETNEWRKLSKYGAEILLKNRISPNDERYEIDGDIEIRKRNAKERGGSSTHLLKNPRSINYNLRFVINLPYFHSLSHAFFRQIGNLHVSPSAAN